MNRRAALDCDAVPPRQEARQTDTCAWQGCCNAGEYRAPKDRRLTDYFVFCLEHVRAYNAKWDFHAGLTATEVEADIRHASTWERPTWKLGTLGAGYRGRRVRDPFGFAAGTAFDPDREAADSYTHGHSSTSPLAARNSALKVMSLTSPFTLEGLKRRYKALVKKHHPDANGGSAEAETRMKIINQAYQTLRDELAASS